MFSRLSHSILRSQQLGLLVVLLVLGAALTLAAGSHPDPLTGQTVNNFLNAHTLIQMATDASSFAIMGVGATIVIISGGHRPVGRRDLCARRRVHGDGPARRRADGPVRHRPPGLRHLPRRQPGLRPRQRGDGHRARRAPVHHHARHDVDAARRRVRDQPRREHPGAVGAHRMSPRRRSGSAPRSIRCRCS